MNKPCLINVETGSFIVTPGELISSHIYLRGMWEPVVINTSKYILQDSNEPVVFDIGSNFGSYAIPIATFIKEFKGIVYAFEPQRKIYNQLCGNIFLNDLDNLFAYHCALGSVISTVNTNIPDYKKFWNPGAFSIDKDSMVERGLGEFLTHVQEEVNIFTLDSLQSSKLVSLLKLDVEGMEYDVLVGSSKFLKNNLYPPIIFEVWNPGSSLARKIFLYLEDFGYILQRLSDTEYIAQHPHSHVTRKYELK